MSENQEKANKHNVHILSIGKENTLSQRGVHIPTLTAYIEKDTETGLYIAVVPQVPGAHTQAETLDEIQKNLKEVVELCLEEMDFETKNSIPEFVGIQQIEV